VDCTSEKGYGFKMGAAGNIGITEPSSVKIKYGHSRKITSGI